jgi:hypothetical protein
MGNHGSLAASPYDDVHVTSGLLPPVSPPVPAVGKNGDDRAPDKDKEASSTSTSSTASCSSNANSRGDAGRQRRLGHAPRLEEFYDVHTSQQLGRCAAVACAQGRCPLLTAGA